MSPFLNKQSYTHFTAGDMVGNMQMSLVVMIKNSYELPLKLYRTELIKYLYMFKLSSKSMKVE